MFPKPRTFKAKYRGYCSADCGDPIEEGDEVEYVDDELMHHHCALDFRPSSLVQGSRCNNCFTVHSPGQKDCW